MLTTKTTASTQQPDKNKDIFQAARSGDIATLCWLVEEKRIDINSRNRYKQTPLHIAAEFSDKAAIQRLIEKGASLEARDTYGNTALLLAAIKGHLAVVECLLVHDANLEARNWNDDNTALLKAAANGHLAVVECLLAHGASLDEKGKHGNTALLQTAANGHLAVVECLLAHDGVSIKEGNKFGETALLKAAANGHLAVVECLLAHGASLEARSYNVYTLNDSALLLAATNGHLAVVECLLAHGASLEARNWNDDTALLKAAANGHLAVVECLLAHRASLEARGYNDYTALLLATANGHLAVVECLLAHDGVSIKEENKFGNTALLKAAANGHLAVVECLLAHGANLEARNCNDYTALLQAAYNGHLAVVECLLAHDASLEARDCNDYTALLLAAYDGHLAVVECLLAHGASLEAKRNDYTALLLAAINGHLAVVECLLAHDGVSIKEENKLGETALLLAAANRHLAVVECLLAHGANLEARDKNGNTALKSAEMAPRQTIVVLYLKFYENLINEKQVSKQVSKALDAIVNYQGNNALPLRFCTLSSLIRLNARGLIESYQTILASWCKDFSDEQCGLLFDYAKTQKDDAFLLWFFVNILNEKVAFSTDETLNLEHVVLNSRYLKSLLAKQLTHTLRFTNCSFLDSISWELFLTLLSSQKNLFHLHLTFCQLNDLQLDQLTPVLLQCEQLKQCDLSGNHITYDSFSALIGPLSRHPSLTHLFLRENYIEQLDRKLFQTEVANELSDQTALACIDLSGNFFESQPADKIRRKALALFLETTQLTPQQLLDADWQGIKPNGNHFILTYKLGTETRECPLSRLQIQNLDSYRKENNFHDTSELFVDLKDGLQVGLWEHQSLANQTISAYPHEEQKEVCKKLLWYHSEAPLKYCLKRHSIFHTEYGLQQAKSLIFPNETITHDSWKIYLLAHNGGIKKEHAMLAFEGLYGSGQRFFKIAHLKAIEQKQGLFKTHKVIIKFFTGKSIHELPTYLQKKYYIATFDANRQQGKMLQRAIEKNINKGINCKFSSFIYGSGSASKSTLSEEDKKKVTQNCLKWAIETIEVSLNLKRGSIPVSTGYVPSWTVLKILGKQIQDKDENKEQSGRCLVM